jgi:predicted membrane-bound mannosyltransferase/DNA-binding beta-propeller fold protein YncE
MENVEDKSSSWLDRPLIGKFKITWETVILAAIFLLAIISRFYLLEPRVMSHDENIHVYHNAWSLFTGQGYRHDPLSHGPFQTVVVALSYFLFGDSDTSARIPAVLFSIATVLFTWNYRRYLGKTGTIVAMVLMLISPYMLYYGRYVRNEAFAAFSGLLMVWGMLRFLETGKARYTYWVTLAIVLHFTAKETSFIYAAQALLFLGLYFVFRISQIKRVEPGKQLGFLISFIVSIVLLGAGGMIGFLSHRAGALSATETAAPALPGEALQILPGTSMSPLVLILLILGVFFLFVAAYFLIRGLSWRGLCKDRSFSLLVLIGTLVLPQLSAFVLNFLKWNIPLNASEVIALTNSDILRMAAVLVPMFIISIMVGLLWNSRLWLINAGIFYAWYILFYTTIFTNGAGFFTGTVGSLGYWLAQQEVNRGSQPWYYYALVQIPIYEYLVALASLFGFGLLLFRRKPKLENQRTPLDENILSDLDIPTPIVQDEVLENEAVSSGWVNADIVDTSVPVELEHKPPVEEIESVPALPMLAFFVLSSLVAFSIAGEKMPWLTVHITWPMILFGGWAIGYVIDGTNWSIFHQRRGWIMLLVLVIFLISSLSTLGALLGDQPPFQGKSLDQLQATSTFLFPFLVAIISGIVLANLVASWSIPQFLRIFTLTIFACLAVLTARTAYQANYINYDNANELLVYAHSAGGVKEVMKQVEEISLRTSDGLGLPVAFDGEYPFWWYLRNYKNAQYYGANPTRSLREMPVIIVGSSNFGKIEPIVGQAYDEFDYIRLWWPNQDYFNFTWDRIKGALLDPQMRKALFQIWLNRDYSQYGIATGRDMSLENWQPSERMRLYIRKDIASKIWEYGSAPMAAEPILADPYEGKQIELVADQVFGSPGAEPGQFQRPRDLQVAPDGSLYVADTDNNRIQHLAADGTVLTTWGTFGDISIGQAPGGTFYQPWGIALGPDGSVYVADTWNHRIQKFSAQGEFIKMWGYFGQAERPEGFWGPRDVAVDAEGRVFVTDTGNKRVVVFDADGNYLTQFGSAGFAAGEFDEPVGITIDSDGLVYVADTWNQRIQVFQEDEFGNFNPLKSFDVAAWYGQSLDNKPYLAVNQDGLLFVADPEGYRVLVFKTSGEFLNYWGDYGAGDNQFGLAAAVGVDGEGGVWVSDAGNSRVMHFSYPLP